MTTTAPTLYRCEECGSVTIHPLYHAVHPTSLRPLSAEEVQAYIAHGPAALKAEG